MWTASGQATQELPGARLAVFRGDGKRVALASSDALHAIDLASGQRRTWQAAGLATLAFSPDGQRVLTGGFDGLARLWQIAKQKLRVWPFPY